jgi:hypothetical protein
MVSHKGQHLGECLIDVLTGVTTQERGVFCQIQTRVRDFRPMTHQDDGYQGTTGQLLDIRAYGKGTARFRAWIDWVAGRML